MGAHISLNHEPALEFIMKNTNNGENWAVSKFKNVTGTSVKWKFKFSTRKGISKWSQMHLCIFDVEITHNSTIEMKIHSPTLKWGEGLSRHVSKGGVHMPIRPCKDGVLLYQKRLPQRHRDVTSSWREGFTIKDWRAQGVKTVPFVSYRYQCTILQPLWKPVCHFLRIHRKVQGGGVTGKELLCKHEDMKLSPQNPHNSQGHTIVYTIRPYYLVYKSQWSYHEKEGRDSRIHGNYQVSCPRVHVWQRRAPIQTR